MAEDKGTPTNLTEPVTLDFWDSVFGQLCFHAPSPDFVPPDSLFDLDSVFGEIFQAPSPDFVPMDSVFGEIFQAPSPDFVHLDSVFDLDSVTFGEKKFPAPSPDSVTLDPRDSMTLDRLDSMTFGPLKNKFRALPPVSDKITCASVQMLMETLMQLIYCMNRPFLDNPKLRHQRPHAKLLYIELRSMLETIFIDEEVNEHQLKEVNDLKKKLINVAEEAQYIIDLFLSSFHTMYYQLLTSYDRLDLEDVRKSFKSIEMEFMSMDSSQRVKKTLDQSVASTSQIFITKSSLGAKKVLDEIVVGLDCDIELIKDKLLEDQKKLVVVSIVGMGGIRKTTLAKKVFNDGYVKYHFYVRVWVTVSQTYVKRDVLIQILESIGGQADLENATDSRLHGMVHKHLMGKRYLIVIDDIWHIETWDNMKLLFPHDNNGSRILLTSRLTEVAKHATSDGFIHHLGCMNKERSWELLCQKVFHGNECPEWAIEPGMQIVESCHGLPLAVVVIAGVLGKEAWSEKLWVDIANMSSSYIVGDHNGCLEMLALSYNHLPLHLRECFLYLGGFPEDYTFKVKRLIWLWVAEGFIEQARNRSLEDIAEAYLMDLIDRNLVIIADRRNCDGRVKTCKVHDIVRELCLRKAKEEVFILKTKDLTLSSDLTNDTTPSYKSVRMFISKDSNDPDFAHPSAQNLRSIVCFSDFRSLSDAIETSFLSFLLLRVLDLQKCRLNIPPAMALLVHLRYLAIWNSSDYFPYSLCDIPSLQTLIYISDGYTVLPPHISNLVNLRHLWGYLPYTRKSMEKPFFLPSIEKPMKLQTISDVELGDGVDNFQQCFPNIKELTCSTFSKKQNDFKSLAYLKTLKLIGLRRRTKTPKARIFPTTSRKLTFPARLRKLTLPDSLKRLTLYMCYLPWSDMSIIQSLPNLEILTLKHKAFEGSCWKTDEQGFPKLKFLRLEWLDIKMWEAHSTSFMCLKQLEIFYCYYLEEVPLEIGDLPTLELIKIGFCRHSAGESVRRIQEEQHDQGNYDLKIDVSDDTY